MFSEGDSLFTMFSRVIMMFFIFICIYFCFNWLSEKLSVERDVTELVRIEDDVVISNFSHSNGTAVGYAGNNVFYPIRTGDKYKIYVVYNEITYSIDDAELYHTYNGRIGDTVTGVFVKRNGITGEYLQLIDLVDK